MFFLISVIPWEIPGNKFNSTTNRIYKDSNEFMKTVEKRQIMIRGWRKPNNVHSVLLG